MDPDQHGKASKKILSEKFFDESREKIELYVSWVFSMILDTCFVAVWLFLTWLVNKLTEVFQLSSVFDQVTLRVYLSVFEISTLIATLLYILQDLAKIWRQFVVQFRGSRKDK